jgi:hypothetical protein
LAVDNADPAGIGPAAEPAGPTVLDPQHVGDIVGALGTLKAQRDGQAPAPGAGDCGSSWSSSAPD